MTLPTVWPLLLLVLTIPQPSAVLCGECEDCNTLVAGLKAVALSQESIVTQQDIIKNTICPDAGLGSPDDHPNCEKFTEHHFPDLAQALFPYFLSPELCSEQFGYCPNNSTSSRVVDCQTCDDVTKLVGGLFGQEDSIVNIIEFLTSEFCVTGVPDQDTEFCLSYVAVVMPEELPWLSHFISSLSEYICFAFGLCQ